MTEREKLRCDEMKLQIASEQGNLCVVCHRVLPANATLAHRIGQGKRNLERYGKKIIHHRLNVAMTCPGDCNDMIMIDNHQEQKRELLERIRLDLAPRVD